MVRLNYREKLRRLSEQLKAQSEDDLIKDVEEAVRLCGQYVQKVVVLEGAYIASNLTKKREEYREYIIKLDEERHLTHQVLISQVKLMNKLCEITGVETIYQGDIDNRVEVGDFALKVTVELFETRKL